MLQITVEKKKYKGVYNWDDITIQKFYELASIPMPEGYDKFLLADSKFTLDKMDEYVKEIITITDKQIHEDFPIYYRQVVRCLTDIPEGIVNKFNPQKLNDLYEYYFKPFVLSILYNTPLIHYMGQIKDWQPENIKSFRLKNQKFYLPRTVKVLDQDVPLKEESILSYTEATDIFRGMRLTPDELKRMAMFMAIYCRKKNELYSEENVLQRTELFMNCPMSIFWTVFFYTIRRLPDYSTIILLFGKLPKTAEQIVSEARTYQNMVPVISSLNVPGMEG
jgi:hypothetical protein